MAPQPGVGPNAPRRGGSIPRITPKTSLEKYEPIQATREVRVLLNGLVRDPKDSPTSGTRHTVTSHDDDDDDDDDDYLPYAEAAVTGTTQVASPGAALVDFVPFLRRAWLPGAGFSSGKQRSHAWLSITEPYALVQHKLPMGDAKSSFLKTLIEEYTARATLHEDKRDIMAPGAVIYVGMCLFSSLKDRLCVTAAAAAAATQTLTAMCTFVLAMVLNPDAYAKAQAEIDRVVGTDRLPEATDRGALPWPFVGPLGVPHALSEYRIPKGRVIIPNMWCVYPGPDVFRPERFWGLSEAQVERMYPRNILLGFGRRSPIVDAVICPGRQFATATKTALDP
ncbi:hypothetical protein FOMPIDRAFT_1020312 [Fomitopsis schrenkii]|uniref:Cytochrome P450 n=1 Tax=Fomitopsis schrenkii TaxID=2126942 RepID=S8DRW9_FOMSC|nr:hypothetical protein FOMPIDRAFT_1020312 [Fomitopsis schrenkii]